MLDEDEYVAHPSGINQSQELHSFYDIVRLGSEKGDIAETLAIVFGEDPPTSHKLCLRMESSRDSIHF